MAQDTETRENDTLSATDESATYFSPASLVNERVLPGSKINCSSTTGWTSLLVQTFDFPSDVEEFETSPTPDLNLVLITKGTREIESFSGGRWKKAMMQPGAGGMTAGGKTERLRLSAPTSEVVRTIHIYLPAYYFVAAAEEYRRAGAPSRLEQPDSLALNDPIVAQMALSLNEAVYTGAPNLYAESAAQFLATHLLSLHSKWSEPHTGIRNPGVISDRRLERVLGFMEHNYMENPSLAQLGREAGISRFHFVYLFKKKCGITPHQHLIQLRMKAAASLLKSTNLSLKEIAEKCGYANHAHLTMTFQKYFAQTPSEYRTKI